MSHLFQLGETCVSPFSIPGSNTVGRLMNLFLYFNFSDRNGLYAKQTSRFVIVTQHSNSHVHEDLKFKFFIVKVISSVVNMTSSGS